MGADIYLESEFKPNQTRWQPLFEAAVKKRDSAPKAEQEELQRDVSDAYSHLYEVGYFRDSYNSYGLFAQMKLSWWRDVVPMLDDNGYLPVAAAEKLTAMVEAEPLVLDSAEAAAKLQNDPPPSMADYEAHRDELLKILRRSIELNEPLFCSL